MASSTLAAAARRTCRATPWGPPQPEDSMPSESSTVWEAGSTMPPPPARSIRVATGSTPSRILDGLMRTGKTLAKFHAQREILEQVARMGVALPPPTDVDHDAPPAYAEVNPHDFEPVARWIARCPDC